MTQQTIYKDLTTATLNAEPLAGEAQRKPLLRIKQADIWQFMRFCMVGSLNAIIDFLVLNVLLWKYPTGDTWRVLGYNSVAVLLAATNSFFWNKYWTFRQRQPITYHEVFRFATVAGGTVLMNDLLMWLLAALFPGIISSTLIEANVLKLAAIIGTMSISFFGMRLWVFFHRRYTGCSSRSPETRTYPISGEPPFISQSESPAILSESSIIL